MSTNAHLFKKRKKMYVAFDCEHCGKINELPVELFIMAYKHGNGKVYCKYCNRENTFFYMDKALERRVAKVKS